MTDEDVELVYDELGRLFVEVKDEPERGLGYIRERLTLCRAMQDRAVELRLKVNRELSTTMDQLLRQQHLQDLAPTSQGKEQMSLLERQKQKLALLSKMIEAQATVLSRTAMDIRLLADLTKEQIKRGEIEPPAELVREVPVNEISPFQQPTGSSTSDPGELRPFDPAVGPHGETVIPPMTETLPPVTETPAPMTTTATPPGETVTPGPATTFNPFMSLFPTPPSPTQVRTVTLDDQTLPPAPEPLALPETRTVSFEDLLTRKDTETHGTPTPHVF